MSLDSKETEADDEKRGLRVVRTPISRHGMVETLDPPEASPRQRTTSNPFRGNSALRRQPPCPEGGHLNTATVSTMSSVTAHQPRTLSSALHRACLAARIASDNKGSNILVLDMRSVTPLYDFFVISTGTSRRQIHAIAEETDAAMRAEGDTRLGIEGYDASKWIVQDYGDIVVHVFDPDTRDYYKLEDLWADAKKIEWDRET